MDLFIYQYQIKMRREEASPSSRQTIKTKVDLPCPAEEKD